MAEQCAWAIGNIAGEDMELRSILFAQGALLPLSRLMLSNEGTTTRTAAWALSNLIKVLAAPELGRKERIGKGSKRVKNWEKSTLFQAFLVFGGWGGGGIGDKIW